MFTVHFNITLTFISRSLKWPLPYSHDSLVIGKGRSRVTTSVPEENKNEPLWLSLIETVPGTLVCAHPLFSGDDGLSYLYQPETVWDLNQYRMERIQKLK